MRQISFEVIMKELENEKSSLVTQKIRLRTILRYPLYHIEDGTEYEDNILGELWGDLNVHLRAELDLTSR